MYIVLATVAIAIALISIAVAAIRRGRAQAAFLARLDSYCDSCALNARLDAACRTR